MRLRSIPSESDSIKQKWNPIYEYAKSQKTNWERKTMIALIDEMVNTGNQQPPELNTIELNILKTKLRIAVTRKRRQLKEAANIRRGKVTKLKPKPKKKQRSKHKILRFRKGSTAPTIQSFK